MVNLKAYFVYSSFVVFGHHGFADDADFAEIADPL
jgi:hypothetical protein